MITAEWFQRLVQSLEFAAGFELFLLIGPGELAEVGLHRLADELGEFGTPRWHALHLDGLDGLLGESEPRVLHFVHGLEHMTEPAVRGVFARLNLERQRLLNIGAPVLFWVPEGLYEEFLRQAPDLIAWRSQVEVVSATELGLAVTAVVEVPSPAPVVEPRVARDNRAPKHPIRETADLLGERYRLTEVLGTGGFTTVWKAYDSHSRRFVAIKVLHGQWVTDRTIVDRFNHGARTMAALEHPAIVPILDGPAQDADLHYFVMPWYEGGDLYRARLAKGIDQNLALLACARAFEGVAHAHAHGFVHGDVTPADILLDDAGRGSIADFDLVRDANGTHDTRTGMSLGFAYSAPDQLERASSIDSRADIYSAGMCTLFVLLGDLPPLLPLLRKPKLLDELPISEELREAIRGALAYDRDQRTTTLAQLIAAIREFVASSGGTSHPRAPAWSEAGQDAHGRWASVRIGEIDLRMRWIEPGIFSMGSPPSEPGRFDNESPQHQVTLTHGFWLAETPCTQALWEAVMGNNPSQFPSPTRPVEQVSWDGAQRFLFELSDRISGPPFQLPTEAQWEYACRAGSTTPTNANAWTWQTSGGTTHPVALNPPNAWGLYDMLGNVWEWCADGPRHYTAEPVVDPLGPGVGDRVRRGGSWGSDARFARAACRDRHDPSDRYGSVGFRIARGDH